MVTPPPRFSRLLAPAELTECLQWALPRYPLERASWILSQLTGKVQSGRTSEIIAAVASHGPDTPLDRQNLLAAAIAVPQVAGAATLLLLQVLDSPASDPAEIPPPSSDRSASPADAALAEPDVLPEVLAPLLDRLRQLGVNFLQAACDAEDQGELLQQAGFQRLADLSLMALPAAGFAAVVPLGQAGCGSAGAAAEPPGHWVSLSAIGEDWPDIFSDIARRTFIETQDCPLLSDFRTADEIVQGYRAASAFDPALSRLLRLDDQWAGCLVLTPHAASPTGDGSAAAAPPPAALELTYMGLIPEYRRRRLSASLLAETVRVAQQLRAPQVVLAVDQKNAPATASYRRLGWQDVAAESVWAMRLEP